jgi:hypothetical protein
MATQFLPHRSAPALAALSRQLAAFDILIVPGRGNSGPAHWQTRLEAGLPGARRVLQREWDQPVLDDWSVEVTAMAARVRKPVLAVAHSFGCLATAAALLDHDAPIAAALLVAPANPDRFAIPFARLQRSLPVPTLLVASRNDPWMSHADALGWAAQWDSEVVDAGFAGHINVASGHGHWPQLPALLARLADLAAAEHTPVYHPRSFSRAAAAA